MSDSHVEVDKKFYINCWRYGKDFIVVACDAEILGMSFHEGDLRIVVSREFYGGKLADEYEVLEFLKSASIGNIIGVRVVDIALRAGLIHRDAILYIGGQPHAQFIRVKF
ncbi:MAG: DUF424 family protein [Candidatus Methanomethylicia archaeon]